MPPPLFRAPKGTHDVLPPESARWEALIGRFAVHVGGAGYRLVVQPTFEDVGVFRRLGEGTDVVGKEMYVFTDRGGREMALRPEGTASVVRAYVQHQPPVPWKVWYAAPCFRYERPQAGRERQHHQLGVEAIGSADPDLDVEVIALGWDWLASAGLSRVELKLNSMGSAEDRVRFRERLAGFLDRVRTQLDPTDLIKVNTNPLRVLDSKSPVTQAVVADAPRITDHLSGEATDRFGRVQAGLTALGIPFTLEPKLVRGLDYYGHTTFEVQSSALEAAQSTVLGGGRYDGLVQDMGGAPTPGLGWGSSLERLLLAADAEGGPRPPAPAAVDVFVVDVVGGEAARDLTTELRRAGLSAERSFDARSMRAQMKAADRSGARLALIVGDQEASGDTVSLRPLRGEVTATTEQETVKRPDVVDRARARLGER